MSQKIFLTVVLTTVSLCVSARILPPTMASAV